MSLSSHQTHLLSTRFDDYGSPSGVPGSLQTCYVGCDQRSAVDWRSGNSKNVLQCSWSVTRCHHDSSQALRCCSWDDGDKVSSTSHSNMKITERFGQSWLESHLRTYKLWTFRTNLRSWIKLVSTVAIGRLSCHDAIFAASDSELPGAAWASPWRTDWKILEHFGSFVRKTWGRFLMIPRCSDLALALANSSYDKLTNTRDFEYSKLPMVVWFLPLRALILE